MTDLSVSQVAGIIAALVFVVTPIGLYETIGQGHATAVPFHYAVDTSPMGYGTPSRSGLGLNRLCGRSDYGLVPCYGGDADAYTNTTDDLDINIPQDVSERFSAGLEQFDSSVSSVFDIEWRSHSSNALDNSTRFQIGAYRQLRSMLLDDEVSVVEGLIVDTRTGGIGFRNHSVPPPHTYGSAWCEDILFLEPETACVDTNLTLEYDAKHGLFSSSFSSEAENMALVDHGGFASLPKTPPLVDDSVSYDGEVDLRARAYRAAWFNNFYTMAYMNLTASATEASGNVPSEIGKEFPLDARYSPIISRDSLLSAMSLGGHLGRLPRRFLNGSLPSVSTSLTAANYSNPFEISQDEFDEALTACKGANGRTVANRSVVAITCGMVFGAPRRRDGTPALLFNPGENLAVPLYTCASATRASLKAVDFRYNGTGDLAGLSVTRVRDKHYPDEESKPLWGVEITRLRLEDANPIWGFLGLSDARRSDLVALRKDSLHLPGFQFGSGARAYNNRQNFPGVDFHVNAMSMAYDITPSTEAEYYAGVRDLGIFSRWQNLTTHAETTQRVLNLVWTDVAANAVLGTKGWHSQQPGDPVDASVVVQRYHRQVNYEWAYGIPAFLVLGLALLTAVFSIFFGITGRATSATVRWYLNATSMGRVYGQFKYPDSASVQSPTREWIESVGVQKVRIGPVDEVRKAENSGGNADS
ncbi:hypothetical protein BJX96DRAFT_173696 [Aspergillus floccosus]